MQTDFESMSVRYICFHSWCLGSSHEHQEGDCDMVVRQVLCESDAHPVQIGHGSLERVDSYSLVHIFRAVITRDAEVAQLLS